MAPPLSNESYHLLKLLKDGQWHNYDQLLNDLVTRVPPGRALRRWEIGEKTREDKGVIRQGPAPSETERIESGARSLAQGAIKGMTRNWLEFQGINHLREVRRRRVPGRMASEIPPELELDPLPEDEPEVRRAEVSASVETKEPEADESDSLLTWEQMSALIANAVRPVIQEELSAFQKAMYAWVSDRFVGVEELVLQQSPRLQRVIQEELSRLRSPFGLPMPDAPADRPRPRGKNR